MGDNFGADVGGLFAKENGGFFISDYCGKNPFSPSRNYAIKLLSQSKSEHSGDMSERSRDMSECSENISERYGNNSGTPEAFPNAPETCPNALKTFWNARKCRKHTKNQQFTHFRR